jgi:hypothetical protein
MSMRRRLALLDARDCRRRPTSPAPNVADRDQAARQQSRRTLVRFDALGGITE